MSEIVTALPTRANEEAVERLRDAAASGVPCAPVRDLIGATDVAAAYAVQHRLTDLRLAAGAGIVGRKIGLTSEAVQQQLGVDRPDFGVLFTDMEYADASSVEVTDFLQPKIEAEIAFVLASDLAQGPLEIADVAAAVDHAVVALEIVDSRIAGWDITFGDTVADNASSGGFVLGMEQSSLDEFTPVDATMELTRSGEVVSTGNGVACLGDPLAALTWLARTARDFGEPLRAGQVVLSGALGPMVPVAAGDTFAATVTGLGSVSVAFASTSGGQHR
jgi:2-keto-4-pentenoate hydratase